MTWLLTTGRASKPLEDFLGGGEQMSERVGMLIIVDFVAILNALCRASRSGNP